MQQFDLEQEQNPYIDKDYVMEKIGGSLELASGNATVAEPKDLRKQWDSLSCTEKMCFRGRHDWEKCVHAWCAACTRR